MDTLDDENTSSVESEVSDNDDVFEHAQYDREEDLLLRRGMMKQNLPSKNTWSFHSFPLCFRNVVVLKRICTPPTLKRISTF